MERSPFSGFGRKPTRCTKWGVRGRHRRGRLGTRNRLGQGRSNLITALPPDDQADGRHCGPLSARAVHFLDGVVNTQHSLERRSIVAGAAEGYRGAAAQNVAARYEPIPPASRLCAGSLGRPLISYDGILIQSCVSKFQARCLRAHGRTGRCSRVGILVPSRCRSRPVLGLGPVSGANTELGGSR